MSLNFSSYYSANTYKILFIILLAYSLLKKLWQLSTILVNKITAWLYFYLLSNIKVDSKKL